MNSPQMNSPLTQSKPEVRSHADVVVVGSGLAGLTAALFTARSGQSVTLLTGGAGSLSISGGCVDVLGYVRHGETNTAVQGRVLDALDSLPHDHPYSLVGREAVATALAEFTGLCAEEGLSFAAPQHGGNHWVPTIMGTLKPTHLCPPGSDPAPLHAAKTLLVAGIDGIKDCQPMLVMEQLRRYPALADKNITQALLTSPFGKTHRSITPLDVARYLDTGEGRHWLFTALTPYAHHKDCILLPPILGTHGNSRCWEDLCQRLQCPLVEMLTIPPGVGGLRLRHVLMGLLRKAGVRVVENTLVTGAVVEGRRCTALLSSSEGKVRSHEGKSFILATGGIMGGGILTEPGKATESVFGLPVDAPTDPAAWSGPDIFGSHVFARLGVRVNARLAPVSPQGDELLHNVHIAGRSLAGYDFASEKSGHGVALVTGWQAARQAATR